MNNKGFTTIELLLVLGFFSVVYFVGVINVTHAFENNPKQAEYERTVSLIEIQAENYAKDNSDLFIDSNVIYVYVKDLIGAQYLATDENGNIVNPLEVNKNLNDLKLKIVKDNDKYEANIVKI